MYCLASLTFQDKRKKQEEKRSTYPWQISTSLGTRSLSLSPIMAVEVVETAWDVTIISDCSLVIDALVLSILVSSSPLYSWLCNADNFFSCSIFTPSLAWNCWKFIAYISTHLNNIHHCNGINSPSEEANNQENYQIIFAPHVSFLIQR